MRTAPPLAGEAPADGVASAPGATIRSPVSTGRGSSSPTASTEPDLSDLAGIDGVTVESRSPMLLASDAPCASAASPADADDAVLALNTALMQGGVVGDRRSRREAAAADRDRPPHGRRRRRRRSFSRDLITVGANASVRFIESHRGTAGVAYQVNVRDRTRRRRRREGRRGRDCRSESDAAQHLASFVATVGDGATLRPSRRQCRRRRSRAGRASSASRGRGARLGFYGATMLQRQPARRHGAGDRPRRRRARPAASCSRASSTARRDGVFQGRIVVEPRRAEDRREDDDARRCSSRTRRSSPPSRSSRSSPTTSSAAMARPPAQIDATMLFYLMARGIPRAEAERLLIEAFLDDAIDAIGDEAIAEALKGTVGAWLARRGGRMNAPATVLAPYDVEAIRRDFPILSRDGLRQAAGLSRQRRLGAEAAGGDRRGDPRLQPRIRQRPSRPALPLQRRDREIRGGAGDRPPLPQRRASRRDHLHPQLDRGDQPRRRLARHGVRRGRRDRALDHGAPLQHRAVALSPRAEGRGHQLGADRRRRHLPPRRIREAARRRGRKIVAITHMSNVARARSCR